MTTAVLTRYEIDVEGPNLERFIAGYRKAGGRVELHMFEGMSQAFISEHPTAPASLDALDKIVEFVHRETH